MSRNFPNFIKAYMDYAQFSEAPKRMHFWTAVSTIAGALKRKVWIDQHYFRWYANFYVVLVAPPGIVSKSTTASIGMSLLRKVPGVKFGPDVVTWQALLMSFAEATEGFQYHDEIHPMSALTLESSEFGNLVNPVDKEMVDLLVSLWDGKQGTFEKKTKTSGNDSIENPWINLIACTTPSWIAGNFPEYMIGGGFTSRCVFVYADQKEKYVAYPGLHVPHDSRSTAARLVEDLTHISQTLIGEYQLSPRAVQWGEAWYEHHYKNRPVELDDERFGGYIARKQTHIHKLAMVLAAAHSDKLVITDDDLALANEMVTDLEGDMKMVFEKIGKTDDAVYSERRVWYGVVRGGCRYKDVYQHVHSHFPNAKAFEDIMAGCIKAGFLKIEQRSGDVFVLPGAEKMSGKRPTLE